MPEEALTSVTASDAYLLFAGQTELLRSESKSRIEYLIPTNNIIVLASYFNLTIKNLISLTGFNTI